VLKASAAPFEKRVCAENNSYSIINSSHTRWPEKN